MYSNWAGLETGANIVEVVLWVWEFATCVPIKAKTMKRRVPAISPHIAMKWFQTAFPGSPGRKGIRLLLAEADLACMPPNT